MSARPVILMLVIVAAVLPAAGCDEQQTGFPPDGTPAAAGNETTPEPEAQGEVAGDASESPPALPAGPTGVDDLLYARPFTLEEGYEFEWRLERPIVTRGYVLVLKVDVDLAYPRASLEPVLYVGDQTAERVNVGRESGCLVVIVPGETDLAAAPVWFGDPELPERVDADMIAEQRSKAEQAGVTPFPQDTIDSALLAGGNPLAPANRDELRGEIAVVIVEYSPQESHLAEGMLPPP